VDREHVRWIVAADEVNLTVHQHGKVEPVEFGDEQVRLVLLAGDQRFLQLEPVVALTAFNLDELVEQRPLATVQIVGDGPGKAE
jgi:hypothetical protein